MEKDFRSKVSFIVETDGLLKDYVASVIIKRIKADIQEDPFENVSSSHMHAAIILKNISPCSLRTFAETMRMSKAAASALVDRMVKAGIVLRRPNQQNRREVLLMVSPKFDAHISRVKTEITLWFENLAVKIGIDNFEKWYEVMVSMNSILREEMQVHRPST